jgi:hypothetical protein
LLSGQAINLTGVWLRAQGKWRVLIAMKRLCGKGKKQYIGLQDYKTSIDKVNLIRG